MRARAFPGEDPATLKPPGGGGGGDGGAAEAGFRDGASTPGSEADAEPPWCSRSDHSDQRHLRDVDAAAAKAAFAIHQIIAPEPVESSSKPAGQPPRRDRRVVAGAPALQRLGIMEAVAVAVPPFEAGAPRRGARKRASPISMPPGKI